MAALLKKIILGEISVYFALVTVCRGAVNDSFYGLLVDDASAGAYVDKSMLIKEYLQVQETIVLITRPRRFGKTVNIDMLRAFLEIEIDQFGNRVPREESISRKLFEGGTIEIAESVRRTLEPLKIATEPRIMERRGCYPVILVRLGEVVGRSYREIERGVERVVSNLFREHDRYLKNSSSLDERDRELYRRYVRSDYADDMLERSLLFLTRVLWQHYGRALPVHVLVDDYDRPLRELTANLYRSFGDKFPETAMLRLFQLIFQSGEFNKLILLLKRILNHCVRNNEALAKSLIAGTLSLDVFGNGDDVIQCRSMHYTRTPFDHFYGFVQTEIDQLCDRLVPPAVIDRVSLAHWLKGYTSFDGDNGLYCSHSVLECVKNRGKLDYYWINGLNESLAEHLLLSDDMQPSMVEKIGRRDKMGHRKDPSLPFECNMNGVHNLLYNIGYLNFNQFIFQVPNGEIRNTLEGFSLKWLRLRLNVTRDNFTRLAELLADFNVDDFHAQVRSLVTRVRDSVDQNVFYDRLMRHLELNLHEFYVREKIAIHRLVDPDLVLISKRDTRYNNAMIIRTKVMQTQRNLHTRTKQSLKNLMRLDNDIFRKHRHVDRILKISMLFYKKTVSLLYGVQIIHHTPPVLQFQTER